MGNSKNKKPKRSFLSDVKKDLQESDKGSYYHDWTEDEVRGGGEVIIAETDFSEEIDNLVTASERKLLVFPSVDYQEETNDDAQEGDEADEAGSRILDISLLSDAIGKAAKCSTCNAMGLSLKENRSIRKGWASSMYLFCANCEKKTTFSSSTHVREDKKSPFVVNR